MKPNYNVNINLEAQDLDIVLLFQIKEKVERLFNKQKKLSSKQLELLKIDKKSFDKISDKKKSYKSN